MKHSQIRKSLSLILAIIMMISTCAVAFSASAADETQSAVDAYIEFIMTNDEVVEFYLDSSNYTQGNNANTAKSRNYRVYTTDDYDMYLSVVELYNLTYAAALETVDSYEPSISSTTSSDFSAWNTFQLKTEMYDALEAAGATTSQLTMANSLCLGSHGSAYSPTSGTNQNANALTPEVSYVGSIITTTDLEGYVSYLETGEEDYSMAYALNFNMHTFSQEFEEEGVTCYIRYFAEGDITIGAIFSADDVDALITANDTTTTGLYPVILTAIEAVAYKDVIFYEVDGGYIYIDHANGEDAGVIVGCSGDIVNLEIPEGVVAINDSIFSYCSTLESVSLPSTLTAIGSEAFRSCTALKSVTITGDVVTISKYAFAYCTALEYVCITGSVESIEYKAFALCSALKTVTLPSTLTSVNYLAFSACNKLETVYFAGTEEEYAALTTYFDSDVEIVCNHVCEDADGDGLCDVCQVIAVDDTTDKVVLSTFEQIIAVLQEYFEAILAIFQNIFGFSF